MVPLLRFIFFLLIFCLCNSLGHADVLLLPEPTGPYGVGTKTIELHDSSRQMLRDSTPKRWMAQVFYPTKKHDKTFPYMPDTLTDGVVAGTAVRAHSKPRAAPLASHKFPVILSFPGRGGERQKQTILYEELASQGYVVVAMDQSYVANFVKFPDGSIVVLTVKDLWTIPRDRDYRYKYDDAVIRGAIGDIDYLLDNWEDLGDLAALCDTSRVILMGHSLGGNVAHIKGFQDARIKAVVDIDSKITERKILGHVGVPPNPSGKPVLFIRGKLQYQEDVGEQLTHILNATILKLEVQHSAFSDDAYFAAKIPGFTQYSFWDAFKNWFFKRGPYFSSIDTSLGKYNPDIWFTTYRSYVVEWLKQHFD